MQTQTSSNVWTLYGTDCCHLCDEAEKLLSIYANANNIAWQHVDIAGLPAEQAEPLSDKIPVLAAGEAQLFWPFSLADIAHIDAENKSAP